VKYFLSELSAGLPAPVYIIYAERDDFDFFLGEACKKIKEHFGGDSGFRFSSYDFGFMEDPESAPNIHKVIDDANSLAFLNERKAVVVENFQLLFKGKKGEEEVEGQEESRTRSSRKEVISIVNDYAKKPSPSSVVVFVWHGRMPTQFTKIKMIDVSMKMDDIKEWCRSLAKERGFGLTRDAIEFILVACGGDFRTAGNVGMIHSEIDKLSLLLKPSDKGKVFDINDIKDVVAFNAETDAFRLGDAMLRGDKGKALSILYALDAKGEIAYKILGGLNYKLSQGDIDSDVFESLNEADVAIKSGSQGAMWQFIIKYFERRKTK
jgi:DNA polymerase III delta subunit